MKNAIAWNQLTYHQAPMRPHSCWAFRAICLGATDVYTPMIHLSGLNQQNPREMAELDCFSMEWEYYGFPQPRQWLQIIGNHPKDFEDLPTTLKTIASSGNTSELRERVAQIDGINLNLGCPDPNIVKAHEGASLLKSPALVRQCIEAFINTNFNIPLSIKLRLGDSHSGMMTQQFMRILEIASEFPILSPSIIHFKHAQQTSQEPCRWEALEPILELNLPIIINGDIKTKQDIQLIINALPSRLQHSFMQNVKGIMIGRELLDNPWIFFQEFNPDLHNPSVLLPNMNKLWNQQIRKHIPPSQAFSQLSNSNMLFSQNS